MQMLRGICVAVYSSRAAAGPLCKTCSTRNLCVSVFANAETHSRLWCPTFDTQQRCSQHRGGGSTMPCTARTVHGDEEGYHW